MCYVNETFLWNLMQEKESNGGESVKQLKSGEVNEEEKEQNSPVCVLEPPFEDDEEHVNDDEGDGFDLESSYAIVQSMSRFIYFCTILFCLLYSRFPTTHLRTPFLKLVACLLQKYNTISGGANALYIKQCSLCGFHFKYYSYSTSKRHFPFNVHNMASSTLYMNLSNRVVNKSGVV